MRYKELILTNFGPYKGKNSLIFPEESSRNLVVIFGDNMRGKTMIMNALRWVFFGFALDRRMQEYDLLNLINKETVASGSYDLSVQLKFEYDGRNYDLVRCTDKRDLVVSPKTSSDLKIKTLMRVDGKSLTLDEIKRTLNFIIPEEVSRFFLFDGELLQEYERLLMEDDDQGTKIKDAIESVLGVPALINGRNELKRLKQEAQLRQAKEHKAEKSTRQKANLVIKLNDELGVLQEEKIELLKREREYSAKFNEIEKQLSEYKGKELLLKEEEALKERFSSLEMIQNDLTREKLSIVSLAWKDLPN